MATIGVIGSGECNEVVRKAAYDIGKGIADAGHVLICGGLGGVMEGACHGAFDAGGLTVGVLPGADPEEANPWIELPIATDLGRARNVVIVLSAAVLIAIEGGPGTLSEVAYALQYGVPVVSLNSFDVSPDILQASSPEDALRRAFALITEPAPNNH